MPKIYSPKQLAALAQDDEFQKVEGMTEAELFATGEPASPAELKASQITSIFTAIKKTMDGDDEAETTDGEAEVKSYTDDFGIPVVKALVIKHPGHEDQSVHGNKGGGAGTKDMPAAGEGAKFKEGGPKTGSFQSQTQSAITAAKAALSALSDYEGISRGNVLDSIRKVEHHVVDMGSHLGKLDSYDRGSAGREGLYSNLVPLYSHLKRMSSYTGADPEKVAAAKDAFAKVDKLMKQLSPHRRL